MSPRRPASSTSIWADVIPAAAVDRITRRWPDLSPARRKALLEYLTGLYANGDAAGVTGLVDDVLDRGGDAPNVTALRALLAERRRRLAHGVLEDAHRHLDQVAADWALAAPDPGGSR